MVPISIISKRHIKIQMDGSSSSKHHKS